MNMLAPSNQAEQVETPLSRRDQAIQKLQEYCQQCLHPSPATQGLLLEFSFSIPNGPTYRKSYLSHQVTTRGFNCTAEVDRTFADATRILKAEWIFSVELKDTLANEKSVKARQSFYIQHHRHDPLPAELLGDLDDSPRPHRYPQERVSRLQPVDQLRIIESRLKEQNPAAEVLRPMLLANLKTGRQTFQESHPELSLRLCQLQALDDLEKFLEDPQAGFRGYFVLATGAGKTVLFGLILRLLQRPGIIFVPNLVLVDQIKKELVDTVGISEHEIGVIDGDSKTFGKKITICTYHSHLSLLRRESSVYRYFLKHIGVAICDEAHRAMGEKTNQGLDFDQQEEFQDVLKLGFTATPQAVDKHIEAQFKRLISRTSYAELVEHNILVPFRTILLDGYILAGQEMVNGLIDPALEDGILAREKTYVKLLTNFLDLRQQLAAQGKKLYPAGFFNRINQAEEFAKLAAQAGLKSIIITSKQDDQGDNSLDAYEKLKQAEQDILEGRADLLLTVNKLAEGWDFPDLNCVLLGSLSTSPRRIIQAAGRSSRKASGKDCTYFLGIDWKIVRTRNMATAAWFAHIRANGIREDELLPGMEISARHNLREAFYRNGEKAGQIPLFCLDSVGDQVEYQPFQPYQIRDAFLGESQRMETPAREVTDQMEGQQFKPTLVIPENLSAYLDNPEDQIPPGKERLPITDPDYFNKSRTAYDLMNLAIKQKVYSADLAMEHFSGYRFKTCSGNIVTGKLYLACARKALSQKLGRLLSSEDTVQVLKKLSREIPLPEKIGLEPDLEILEPDYFGPENVQKIFLDLAQIAYSKGITHYAFLSSLHFGDQLINLDGQHSISAKDYLRVAQTVLKCGNGLDAIAYLVNLVNKMYFSPFNILRVLKKLALLNQVENIRFLTLYKFDHKIIDKLAGQAVSGRQFLALAEAFFKIKDHEELLKHLIEMAKQAESTTK